MNILGIVTQDHRLVESVRHTLPGWTLLPIDDVSGFKISSISRSFDFLLLDTAIQENINADEILRQMDPSKIVIVTHQNTPQPKLSRFYLSVESNNISTILPGYLQVLGEKQYTPSSPTLPPPPPPPTQEPSQPHPPHFYKHTLLKFAELLTVNFDVDKTLEHFIALVIELTTVNRVSILLREDPFFTMRAQAGIDPSMTANVKLSLKSPLVTALAEYGRIIRRERTSQQHQDIYADMIFLRCTVSIPITYRGRLQGILNLGDKITGEPFTHEELETIYLLSSYLMIMLNDFDLHHKLQKQRDFINNILLNMTSGVITIDRLDKISIINQKAADILGLDATTLMGKDIRSLPSPLGDILFETMETATTYIRHEVTVGQQKTRLGINSYVLHDEKGITVGSGIIFSDISVPQRLELEKRRSERFKLMNIISGRIAHEIKNPLTAVQTFTQLLQDRYDHTDFREFFTTTVSSSLRRLDALIDKIIIFSNPIDFAPETIDICDIVEEAITKAKKDNPAVSIHSTIKERPIHTEGDRHLLFKGLYYLLLTCAENLTNKGSLFLEVLPDAENNSYVTITVLCPGIAPIKNGLKEPRDLLDMETLGMEFDLYVAKKIIEEHSGKLDTSVQNNSNLFTISLPLVKP
jgi:nitrogen-specific signal transduction histidine kinase